MEELEEGPDVRRVQLQRSEVGPHALIVEVLLELLYSDGAGPIHIDVPENVLKFGNVSLFVRQRGLRHEILVPLGAVDRCLAENACDHVQHSELRETYVDYEDADVDGVQIA
eukprot:CAMPEP_0115550050 /NCGR_PEP_ID=MMETSP0271-20121206/95018_1 /TAXON_ID=71861 /ORGANISM="Scrippsiella trochoidea, Strain CCMP3099" /LENGTH=111 /DNA_ID=CAMNT_0002983613 /DNA_START=89 /DNA_END=424 /DNA_ORIENTATION=-